MRSGEGQGKGCRAVQGARRGLKAGERMGGWWGGCGGGSWLGDLGLDEYSTASIPSL